MSKIQLTQPPKFVVASEDNPVKIKALSPGVEVRGHGLDKGDEVEVTVTTAVAGFGQIQVTDPSEKKAAPKRKPVAKKAAPKAAPKKAAAKKATTKARSKK